MQMKLVTGYTFASNKVQKLGLVCYVVGYGGHIKQYSKAVKTLNNMGYDVQIYEYVKDVFTSGDPALLSKIIDDITTEINDMSTGCNEVVCAGVSLGSFIAFNVQKRVTKAFVGVYADAGISVAHAIFTAKVFSSVAETYSKNGYDEESLAHAWHLIDIKPRDPYKLAANKSLVIYSGGRDNIVRLGDAKANLDAWRAEGTRIKQIVKPLFGHIATGYWFIKNTKRAFKVAQVYHVESE